METLGVRYCPRPPVFWFGHPSVGPNELAVLMVLLAHSAPDGTCWPSQGRIAALLKRSRPWANAVLTRLAEAGLVMSIQRSLDKGGRTSCLYRLVGVDRSGSGQAKEEHDETCLSADTPCNAPDTNMSHTKPNDSHSGAWEGAEENVSRSQDEKGMGGQGDSVPSDWVPTAADAAWAKARCPNLDVLAFTETFVLTCRAKDYRYADISAAWRRWLVEPKGRLPLIRIAVASSPSSRSASRETERVKPSLAEANSTIAQACLDRINARRGL
jgi:hypothetical protein